MACDSSFQTIPTVRASSRRNRESGGTSATVQRYSVAAMRTVPDWTPWPSDLASYPKMSDRNALPAEHGSAAVSALVQTAAAEEITLRVAWFTPAVSSAPALLVRRAAGPPRSARDT